MKSIVWAFLVIIGMIFLLGAAVIWSGTYNVAADVPHWNVTLSILDAAREQSVETHSKDIVPPPLRGEQLIDRGFPHFHAMCRFCHGAPGTGPVDFALGLYPKPPLFPSTEVQQELSDAELYWIVRHGLKMTGMPSFGVTQSEEDLWAIVAFVRRLPTLSPQEYQGMVQKAGLGSGEGEEKHS